jgi:glycosyl transferase family 25
MPVYVINLARDRARRDYMEGVLTSLGLAHEFVPGVDGQCLTAEELAIYDRERCRHVYGSDMRPGEIGCYLGHYRLYERLLREKVEVALILEDDVRIDPSLPAIVEGIEKMRLDEWSIIHLRSGRGNVYSGIGTAFRGNPLADLGTGHSVQLLRTHILSGGAYFINQDGLRRMIEYGRRIFMPIDHTMDRYWENGILPMVVRPLPVGHNNEFESSIGNRGAASGEAYSWWDRTAHRWRRSYDSLPKRWFWVWRRLCGKPV